MNGRSWRTLGTELLRRTLEPLGHASFVIYFVLAVVIVGGVGVWLEVILYLVSDPFSPLVQEPGEPLKALVTAVITFFSALAGSAAMQVIWAENRNKALRAYASFVLVASLIAALLIGLLPKLSAGVALTIGCIATFVSLWTWWVANAKQQDFRDTPADPDDPVGGDPEASLAGTLQGFRF